MITQQERIYLNNLYDENNSDIVKDYGLYRNTNYMAIITDNPSKTIKTLLLDETGERLIHKVMVLDSGLFTQCDDCKKIFPIGETQLINSETFCKNCRENVEKESQLQKFLSRISKKYKVISIEAKVRNTSSGIDEAIIFIESDWDIHIILIETIDSFGNLTFTVHSVGENEDEVNDIFYEIHRDKNINIQDVAKEIIKG